MDVTPLVQSRGMGRYVGELLHALRREGVDVVGSLRTGKVLGGDLVRYWVRARREGIQAYPSGMYRLPGISRWMDIFHAVEPASYIPTSLPTVVTFHDLALFRKGGKYDKIARRIRNTPPQGVIAVSQYTATEVRHAFPELSSRIHVVYHGVQREVFRKISPEEGQGVLRGLGLSWKGYFLYVGEADDRKNLGILHRIVADRSLPPLVMVGTSPSRLARYLDPEHPGIRVISPQTTRRLAAIYAGAIALLFPSTEEGFGFPVLEAMACGTLVVTTKKTAIPEVGGDVPVYLPADDPEAWHVEAWRLARGGWEGEEVRIQQGLDRAQRFSWEETARQTLGVYQKVQEHFCV